MAQVKYAVGDKLTVVGNSGLFRHQFDVGTQVAVVRIYTHDLEEVAYDCVNHTTGDMWWVEEGDLLDAANSTIKQDNTIMKLMKDAVRATALNLCQANNTVTTLEIKAELRKTHPYFHWIQNSKAGITGVSEYMDELHNDGEFIYSDNGQYRVYSAMTTVKPKKVAATKVGSKRRTTPVANSNHNVRSISRQKALDMMMNNKGHFFTATFIKKNGDKRTMNCQYMKDQKANPVGYVMVREAQKMKDGVNSTRQINLQTLESIRIGGQNYNIRK